MSSLLLATFGSVMLKILYVVIAIVVLLTMVLIHELGHYIAGRILGFTITEFSIGFGKAIWQKRNKRGELISFRIFPLGGYCAFLGESEENPDKSGDNKDQTKELIIENEKVEIDNSTKVEDNEKLANISQDNALEKKDSEDLDIDTLLTMDPNEVKTLKPQNKGVMFNDQKPWKRIIVFLAGVTFNFLSAFIFSIMFLAVGAYDGYALSAGSEYNVNLYSVETNQVIGTLQDETLVYAINGKEINYARANVFDTLVSAEDNQITFTILLDGEKQDVIIKKENKEERKDNDGNITLVDVYGISYRTVNIDYNFLDILRDFIPFTFRISVLILKAFWMIITGGIGINQLGGPISTITQISEIASLGIANFLYLLPLLAANLAIFNILPFPGLDGAHVVFTTIELIRGKPIKREVEGAIHTWGIILLFAFVIIIDIVHLVTT